MFCKSCGKQIPDGAVTCPFCGQNTAAAPTQKIESHLVEAILVTLFCCMPFGVVSIVYAAQVSSLAGSGNFEAAQEASKKAHKWAMVSLGVGLVSIILYVLLQILVGVAANM